MAGPISLTIIVTRNSPKSIYSYANCRIEDDPDRQDSKTNNQDLVEEGCRLLHLEREDDSSDCNSGKSYN